jgi:hypothetical protein
MGTVLLSFVLLTLVGGAFAYRLQHANWLRQQKIESRERLVAELRTIFVDLDLMLSRRLFRTRRLLYALRQGNSERISKCLGEYDEVVCDWNERRNSFQVRLVRVISQELARQFEFDLSSTFVGVGSVLERLVRTSCQRKLNRPERERLTELEGELDLLSRSVYEFVRTIYIHLQDAQGAAFSHDQRLPEDDADLGSASIWFLLRSLFVPPRPSA